MIVQVQPRQQQKQSNKNKQRDLEDKSKSTTGYSSRTRGRKIKTSKKGSCSKGKWGIKATTEEGGEYREAQGKHKQHDY